MQELYDDLRCRSESELEQRRRRIEEGIAVLEATLDAATEGVLVVGPEGGILQHNRRFLEIWGMPDEVLPLGDAALLERAFAVVREPTAFSARVAEIYADPHAVASDVIETRDGRTIERYSAPVLQLGRSSGRVWFFRDVTEARRLQDALREANRTLEERVRDRTRALEGANRGLALEVEERRRAEAALRHAESELRIAQKMEAIGRLAGGIAHDFNNMLAVVLSCCALLDDLVGTERARVEVDQIRQAGERAAELVRQLLTFSRASAARQEAVDVARSLREAKRMLVRVLGYDVELRMIVPERAMFARLEPGQIEQALLNLVLNARDAMPGGGRITVRLERADRAGDSQVGAHLVLSVEDQGVGMDAETKARIFEPFFTTKAPGKGTGLGLAGIYGMVRRSGGEVQVVTEVGNGTTFVVYLPEVDPPPASPATIPPPAPTMSHRATVLLVDDEDLVRRAIARVLTRAHVRVVEATSAADALMLHSRHAASIDLVLSDVVMPGGTGDELAAELARRDATLPVLLMSGHAPSRVVDEVARRGMLLLKPIAPDVLLAKIEALLAARPPTAVGARRSL